MMEWPKRWYGVVVRRRKSQRLLSIKTVSFCLLTASLCWQLRIFLALGHEDSSFAPSSRTLAKLESTFVWPSAPLEQQQQQQQQAPDWGGLDLHLHLVVATDRFVRQVDEPVSAKRYNDEKELQYTTMDRESENEYVEVGDEWVRLSELAERRRRTSHPQSHF